MEKLIIIGGSWTPEPCESCGKVDELRPYGKNGAKICFDCGMKPENIAQTEQAFDVILKGNDMEIQDNQTN